MPRKDPPGRVDALRAQAKFASSTEALHNGRTKSSRVKDAPREISIDPSKNTLNDGVATQNTWSSVPVEAADGTPDSMSTAPVDRDKAKSDPNEGVLQGGLSSIIRKERPRTRQSRCSTIAVMDGRHNSWRNSGLFSDEENSGMVVGEQKNVNEERCSRNSNLSQALDDIIREKTLGEQEDNTSRDENEDKDEDHDFAATERRDARRHKPRPAQCKGAREVAVGETRRRRVPLYHEGMEVGYRSGSLPLQAAIILSVHQDDLLEPYYTIRMRDDGREKQTDNVHLVPGH